MPPSTRLTPCARGWKRADDPFVTCIERTTRDEFKIRLVTGDERGQQASFLVRKRYAEAGYVASGSGRSRGCPAEITLLFYLNDQVVSTLTVGMNVS